MKNYIHMTNILYQSTRIMSHFYARGGKLSKKIISNIYSNIYVIGQMSQSFVTFSETRFPKFTIRNMFFMLVT